MTRFSPLAVGILCAVPVCTSLRSPVCAAPQKPAVKASAPRSTIALPIALPPRAQVEFEVDGGEEDVLGMLKAFARGLEAANAPQKGAASSSRSAWVSLLADKQVSAILKDVRRLHLVVYKMPENQENASGTMSGGTMSGGTMSGTMEVPVLTPRPQPAPFDVVAFHEKPLLALGGRRNLLGNFGSTKVRMFDFTGPGHGQPRGFGLIVQSPSRVFVARAQGVPNLAALGRLIRLG